MPVPNTQRPRRMRNAQAVSIARGLGWFSIGLGLAQILAPRVVCRITGMPPLPTFTRLCGMRELACGVGLLAQREAAPWLKARVAGDAMDLACLAGCAPVATSAGGRIAVSIVGVAAVTALDVYCARAITDRRMASPLHVRTSIAINKPREDLYRFWRDFQNLPRVMPHLKSVQMLDGGRSHWVAQGPGDIAIEWDSEVIDDVPDERLAWRSLESSDIYNAGSVCFDSAPAGRGTVVTLELLYDPPAATIGALLAKLMGGSARHEIRADLRAFKQLMEAGEIATTRGQSSGASAPGRAPGAHR